MDMKADTRACVERNPKYRAVKFTKELIDGFGCVTASCGLFGRSCEKCMSNTRTPYVIIDNQKVFVIRNCDYPCTHFNPHENFYIVKDETSGVVKFLSEKEFNKKYEFF